MTPVRSSPLLPLVGVTEVTSTEDQIDSFPSVTPSARHPPTILRMLQPKARWTCCYTQSFPNLWFFQFLKSKRVIEARPKKKSEKNPQTNKKPKPRKTEISKNLLSTENDPEKYAIILEYIFYNSNDFGSSDSFESLAYKIIFCNNIQCLSETVDAVLFCFTKIGKNNTVLIKQTKLIIIQKTNHFCIFF